MLNLKTHELKDILKDIYNITNTMIAIFDDEYNYVCGYPEVHSEFCSEIRKSSKYSEQCRECDRCGIDISRRTNKIYIYHCHIGLTEVVAPISENGFVIGYVMFGQTFEGNNKKIIAERINNIPNSERIDKKKLLNELENMTPITREQISSITRIMEICICYLHQNHIISSNNESLAFRINKYIYDNISSELSIKTICKEFNISRSLLYAISSETFKMGISDYIRTLRIERAKELLRTTDMSISLVCEAVGMCDSNYFIKIFKKYVGMTPHKWKKKLN